MIIAGTRLSGVYRFMSGPWNPLPPGNLYKLTACFPVSSRLQSALLPGTLGSGMVRMKRHASQKTACLGSATQADRAHDDMGGVVVVSKGRTDIPRAIPEQRYGLH